MSSLRSGSSGTWWPGRELGGHPQPHAASESTHRRSPLCPKRARWWWPNAGAGSSSIGRDELATRRRISPTRRDALFLVAAGRYTLLSFHRKWRSMSLSEGMHSSVSTHCFSPLIQAFSPRVSQTHASPYNLLALHLFYHFPPTLRQNRPLSACYRNPCMRKRPHGYLVVWAFWGPSMG